MSAGDDWVLREIRPPQQARSRATFERILDAADMLLQSREIGDITVNDLCNEADVAIGSFYQRFPRKELVVRALFDRALLRLDEHFAWVAAGMDGAAGGLDAIETAVERLLTLVESGGRVLLSIKGEPGFETRSHMLEEALVRATLQAFEPLTGVEGVMRRRVELSVQMFLPTLRDPTSDFNGMAANLGLTRQELCREFAILVLAYLTAPEA